MEVRIFLFSCILTGFFVSSYSQGTRISVSGHPQMVWFASGNESVKNEGLVAGISSLLEFDFFFAERYSFYTGISLDNTGGRLGFADTILFSVSGEKNTLPAGNELLFRIQYLGIPLGLKLRTQEIGYTTFFINMGLTPMVNLRSRIDGTGISPGKVDGSDETRLFNTNYFVNAGVEYSLGGSTSLIGGIGFNSGFFDITTRTEDKICTRSFYLKTGILF